MKRKKKKGRKRKERKEKKRPWLLLGIVEENIARGRDIREGPKWT